LVIDSIKLQPKCFDNYRPKIILNFDADNDWWAVYVQDMNEAYHRYGYLPAQRRFAYNEKPRGIVKALRLKLDAIYNQLERHNRSVEKPQGCAYIIAIFLVIILLFEVLV